MKIERNTVTLMAGAELSATELSPFNREELSSDGRTGPVFDGTLPRGRVLGPEERRELAEYMAARWMAWGGDGAAVLPNAPGRCKVRSSHFHVMDDGRQVFCGGSADKTEPQRQAAIPSSLAGNAAAEHPAPWRWEDGDDNNGASLLLDSTGAVIISVNKFTGWETPDQARMTTSPVVRELLRLAPELEAALRKNEWNAHWNGRSCCPECKSLETEGQPHAANCSIGLLLAALDAARAVKP